MWQSARSHTVLSLSTLPSGGYDYHVGYLEFAVEQSYFVDFCVCDAI